MQGIPMSAKPNCFIKRFMLKLVFVRWLRKMIPTFFARALGVRSKRKATLFLDLSRAATLKDLVYWLQIFFSAGIATLGLGFKFSGGNYRRDAHFAADESDSRVGFGAGVGRFGSGFAGGVQSFFKLRGGDCVCRSARRAAAVPGNDGGNRGADAAECS